MLVYFLKSLDKKTLARQVYDQQVEHNWPGLANEARSICQRIGLEDVNAGQSIEKGGREEAEEWHGGKNKNPGSGGGQLSSEKILQREVFVRHEGDVPD